MPHFCGDLKHDVPIWTAWGIALGLPYVAKVVARWRRRFWERREREAKAKLEGSKR